MLAMPPRALSLHRFEILSIRETSTRDRSAMLLQLNSITPYDPSVGATTSRWIGEPVDSIEEYMGQKDKKIPKSPSRLHHSCEAVSDATLYHRRMAF